MSRDADKCSGNIRKFCRYSEMNNSCDECAHKPDQTSAGQVGSSGLLVAREGDQQLDTTASQLGPLVARDELIDKSGGGYVCSACHYPFTNEEDLKNHYCDD